MVCKQCLYTVCGRPTTISSEVTNYGLTNGRFVLVTHNMNFKFYILSKSEVEELIRKSNNWYMNEYVRDNEISNQTPVGIKLKHLMGKEEDDTMHTTHKKKHAAYINPLGHDAENRWDKIWE